MNVTGDKVTANSYSMSELHLVAVNRFLGFSLHWVNSSSVFQRTGGQIFEKWTEWKWKAVSHIQLDTDKDIIRWLAGVLTSSYDKRSPGRGWVGYGKVSVGLGYVCSGRTYHSVMKLIKTPVTLSCSSVDLVQSTPHTPASWCWLSDRNSTFRWGHGWGSATCTVRLIV